ncbi:MAG: DUF1893 domain-containing protein, partial [Bacteroidota bacterium]|nr:DUF1893 domain-containing protein [Bacteroidota bacterium]
MTDIDKAKNLLLSNNFTCVLCKDDNVHSSAQRGVSPMVEFINSGLDLNGFSAADKIVGKALAMLFAMSKVKEVYAVIMSERAIEIFEKYNIQYSYKTLVKAIINREGTGPCPMEATVKDIDDLSEAFSAIKNKLDFLRSKSQGNA